MILIADSGSTKTEWRILGGNESSNTTCITNGINPFYQSTDDIFSSLKKEFRIETNKISEIYFYGAGCINDEKNTIVKKALSLYFNTNDIKVYTDLLGVARSLCGRNKGIACILGTGSNSCLYDGNKITDHVSPLGYIIGDEGSGAVLGKKLIGDVLKNQFSANIIGLFYQEYETNRIEILENIYKKPFPNQYLANFTKFLSKYIHLPEIEKLVIQSFDEFVKRNLLQYDNVFNLEIHFAGSIAFHFEKQLKKVLRKNNLILGKITRSPMDGLISFHSQ